MKQLLLVLAISMVSFSNGASAFAANCADLSGTYLPASGLKSDATVVLKQTGCEQMDETLVYSTLNLHTTILTDGQMRLTAQMPDLHSKTYESNSMTAQGMVIAGKTYQNDVLNGTTQGLWSLDAQGNLHELYDYYDVNGKLTNETKNDYVKQEVCLNISGDYVTTCGDGDDATPAVLHIVQDGCKSLELTLSCNSVASIAVTDVWCLDGVKHPSDFSTRTGTASATEIDLTEDFLVDGTVTHSEIQKFTFDAAGKLHRKIEMNDEETYIKKPVQN